MAIPTRGLCHSIFLLAYSATSNTRTNKAGLLSAARRIPTFMSDALAMDAALEYLLELRLASIKDNRVILDKRLTFIDQDVSTATLARIAMIILHLDPPQWLPTVVLNGELHKELIPSYDEQSLAWLGGYLEPFLLETHKDNKHLDAFKAWLGNIGEQIVLANEIERGHEASQVSLISDSFGFDIESFRNSKRLCLEVKTSLESRAERFFVSRNEVNKAGMLHGSWALVHIILSNQVATAEVITREHLQVSRMMPSKELMQLTPCDSSTGIWTESALIQPDEDAWSSWPISIPKDWSHPGFENTTN